MKNYKSILKISLFILSVIGYSFYLSPTVEQFIKNRVGNLIYQENTVIAKTLSPVHKYYPHTAGFGSGISVESTEKMVAGYTNVSYTDPRIVATKNFLLDYNSPMYPYADVFVNEADRYGLDWRLVVAISGVESAFGRITPRNSNNAWGWRGGRTETGARTWSSWSSWGEGIESVTRGLAVGYGTNLTPRQIEPAYCPPCAQEPTHPWSNGVSRYMRELDYYVERL